MNNSSALQINEDIKKNWGIVQQKLKESYGLDVYKSWIQNVEAKGIDFACLILIVKTRFVRDWIVSHYADKILDHYQKLDNSVSRIQFEINEIFDEKRSTNILDFGSGTKVIDLKDTNYGINRIDPRLNFETFVTGESNQLAFSAAKRVTVSLGHYNPLYIYGGVGLGKTHILNAIGNQLKQLDKKVIYLSAERFKYQFVKSIKNKDTHKFKEIFRNADVLILDDIQFISGKEVTQEEFFYTFNILLENQSQVVISCDRSPNELDRIQDRIKSRLSGGLVVDVQPPDIGLRLDILKKRCLAEKNHFGNEIMINDEIGIEFRYPTVGDMGGVEQLDQGSQTVEVIKKSIKSIYTEEDVFLAKDTTDKELTEFVENLTVQQLEKLGGFFQSLPRLQKDVSAKCNTCGKPIEKVLIGLQNFF